MNGILLIDDAPEPFVGMAGFQLGTLLRRLGTTREAYGITSTFGLDEAVQRLRPKVLVPMGPGALDRVTGNSEILRYRGFTLNSPYGIPVVGTLHPNFLLPRRGEESSSKYVGCVLWDLLKAHRIATEGLHRIPVNYLLDPSPNGAGVFADEYETALADDPDLPLAFDIETVGSLRKKDESEFEAEDFYVVRISFAFRPGHALAIVWAPQYMDVIRRLLVLAGVKATWNGRQFDIPVVTNNRVVVAGLHVDCMDAFHFLQPNLPRGLEFATSFYGGDDLVPWKHLGKAQPAYYSALDADATVRCYLGIMEGLAQVEIAA